MEKITTICMNRALYVVFATGVILLITLVFHGAVVYKLIPISLQDPHQSLAALLQTKLNPTSIDPNETSCAKFNITYPCTVSDPSKCPRDSLPQDPKERIRQVAFRDNLQVSPHLRNVMRELRQQVPGQYEVVFLSGLSSNHYKESQKYLHQIHTVMLPIVKNSTLIVYDLGLTQQQHEEYKNYCRCHLLKFPFERLPDHYRTLRCFGWKPFIIRTHMEQTQVLFWNDAAVRYHHPDKIHDLIERVKERGIQQASHGSAMWNPIHTLPKTFEYFGDSPCAHIAYRQVHGYFGGYHREPLIERAILDPWVACGANEMCTCPMGHKNHKAFDYCPKTPPYRLGMCHRHDQSALTIILTKLFGVKRDHFAPDLGYYQGNYRGSSMDYFAELKKKGTR